MTTTITSSAPARRPRLPSFPIAGSQAQEPDTARIAMRWVARRYRVSPDMAAAIVANTGLGGSTR